MKKKFVFLIILFPIVLVGQEKNIKTSQNKDVVENYKRLTSQQLFDTADYYFKNNSFDTALVYFNSVINTIPQNSEIEQQKNLCKSYAMSAHIYSLLSDYRKSYDYLIKALLVCEKNNFYTVESNVYLNIGNIYSLLSYFEMAKYYYLKALNSKNDTLKIISILNNLGANELADNMNDSAFYYLDKAIKISKRHNNYELHHILNNFGSLYQNKKQYDSAFYYFNLSLELSRTINSIEVETRNLSDIGKMFFELNNIDSAIYYINMSNKIALENKFIKELSSNYLTLSEIERSKGNFESALNHYIRYTNLKDSISNSEVVSSVHQQQRMYEISKTNQHIEELEIDRQIKENTIRYQKKNQRIVIVVFILAIGVLLFILYQNKKIRTTSNALYSKNVEIVKIESKTTTKKKKSSNSNEGYLELMKKIFKVMEDSTVYCSSSFSADFLASLIKSNHNYIAKALRSTQNKNFRTFLNEFRIKEAQRLFMEMETKKFTIEFISEKVGYKSRSSFYSAFKEITGMSPNDYIKSREGEKEGENGEVRGEG